MKSIVLCEDNLPIKSGESDDIQMLKEKLTELEKQLDINNISFEQQIKEKNAESLRLKSLCNLDLSDVKEDFICTICCDVIINAVSTHCGHTFCYSCLYEWRKKSTKCPLCRMSSLNYPSKNFVIDSFLEKMNCIFSTEEQLNIIARNKKLSEIENSQCESLQKLAELSISRGTTFLAIDSPWKQQEKNTFKVALNKHSGRARLIFFNLIGLNIDWISSTTFNKLIIACSNLEIMPTNKVSIDIDLLRTLLQDFIHIITYKSF